MEFEQLDLFDDGEDRRARARAILDAAVEEVGRAYILKFGADLEHIDDVLRGWSE